ncbi:stage II sporulation protein M [Cryomorpha ignava]|uniref:Stage II sporulation protein M n=1 Tax=Cryomorpha ignava TaxID=101383 RepID=A0A7K3WP85_9FLAO|nr:stage II sporulation protein M [Cryomorpha ignava]NEN23386.1 stage II sporulation protein M [Cryomorpha ignava]
MREKDFVEQNKENWSRFERLISGEVKSNPDELSELYNQITSDLSYARTYYNKRSIRVYLNQLAKTVYLGLYKHRRGRWKSFASFWTDSLPLALYRARKELNVSLLFFLASMMIGVLSSVHEPDFAQVILGERYVNMTEDNIKNGEPMAVYESSGEIDMFFSITYNNLLVAFRTYILGAFFGVGTLIILLYNGIMVGTFQYFFIERSLFQESFLTIWMHGALEISAIVIAGGAGLTIGRGILFPGTLPRLQSFQIGARRSIKIMLGLIPVFMVAAFIEGFFTRLTELPDFFRAAFIILCFAFIALYFWWYPWRKFHNANVLPYDTDQLIPELEQPLDIRILRKTREIFTASFVVFRKLFFKLLIAAVGLSFLYTAVFWALGGSQETDKIAFDSFSLYNLYQFHSYNRFPQIFFPNLILVSAVLWLSFLAFKKSMADKLGDRLAVNFTLFLKIAFIVALFELTLLSGNALAASLGIIAIPFLSFWMTVSAIEGSSLPKAFSRMLALLNGTKRHIFITFASLALISVLLIFLLDSPFTWFYVEIIQWNIEADAYIKQQLAMLSLLFINQLGLALVIPLILSGQIMEYFSAVEAREAEELAERVMQIGVKRSAYGMERE